MKADYLMNSLDNFFHAIVLKSITNTTKWEQNTSRKIQMPSFCVQTPKIYMTLTCIGKKKYIFRDIYF